MNPGDVVQLRSGGPRMTVVSYKVADGLEYVRCVYFVPANTTALYAELPKLTLKVIREQRNTK